MSGWYVAPALAVLRAEIDTRWPRRDRTSDGSIGDAAHQASRSDHNPNERDSVNAIDVDKDGIDVAAVIAAVESHPSTHYWIYDRQIADRDDGFRRRPYTGSNPHDKHLHVSIRQTRTAEQDRRPWGLLEDDMELTGRQATQLAEVHDYLMRLRVGMETMSDGKRSIEQTKWRKRDETWQRRADGLLVALAASVQGLDMDAVLRRLDEHAAAEAGRDAELRALVQASQSGELTAEQVLTKLRDLLPADTTPQS
ncbi:hypothetical protein [Micromonospora sp. L32]|uniref:hypothetical protein n=1 Tax=Micromonospora sp. L32 TaxID=3452214 RepID=UPI003F89D452